MLKGNRNEKVALEIKQVIAEAVLNNVRDPRVGFVTITDVDLSPDLKNAIVFCSILEPEKEKGSLIALNYAKGYFQQQLADKLNLRVTPKVEFRIDQSVQEGAKIDAIINKLHSEKKPDPDSEA